MSRRGWLLFTALGVIWGVPYLLIRISVREVAPSTLVFFRTAPVALILLPVAAYRGQIPELLRRWRPLLLYTVVEIMVPWLMLFKAEERLDTRDTTLAAPQLHHRPAGMLSPLSADHLHPQNCRAIGFEVRFA